MTHYTVTDLQMADRHIAEGEAHIVHQEELLTLLRLNDHPTEEAETLLKLFNETQVEHRAHREAIAKALEEALQFAGLPCATSGHHRRTGGH